jgi:hypothetical protein
MSDLHIVEDTSPQLGGDLDLNGHAIAGATATEIGSLSGVTSAIQTQLDATEKTANKNQPNGYPGLDANGNLVGTIIPRNGTTAEIDQIVLLAGELTYCTDSGEVRVGDGATAGGIQANFILRHDTAAEINQLQLLPAELAYCTDTHEIRVGDGQTLGGTAIGTGTGVGETNLNSGSFNAVTTTGYPLRAYTSSDGSTALIAGGDYTAEFTDAPTLFISGGSQATTSFTGASYDSGTSTTTINTAGGLGAAGSIVAFPAYSAACGVGCSATGAAAFAANGGTMASGNFSHAEGGSTTAAGNFSHAEGSASQASGDMSHAEGNGTTASGVCSHAEALGTTASSDYSHAEGANSVASGFASHAEGGATTASGLCSHAEGGSTTASGAGSHAEGASSLAAKSCQRAIASSQFDAPGDAQYTEVVVTCNTADTTPTPLNLTDYCGDLDNVNLTPVPFTCDTNKTYAFLIHLAARKDDGTSAMFARQAVIKNVNNTVSLEGAVQTVGVDINPANWAVAISADDTNKCLQILVTGADANNIRWVAMLQAVEIGF